MFWHRSISQAITSASREYDTFMFTAADELPVLYSDPTRDAGRYYVFSTVYIRRSAMDRHPPT